MSGVLVSPTTIRPDRHFPRHTPLDMLKACGGYYECPRDSRGMRRGPLVGYSGRYETADGERLQFVGDVYVNFAKVERHAPVLQHFALLLAHRLEHCCGLESGSGAGKFTGFVGAPEGGKALALSLATVIGCQYVYPEREEVKAAGVSARAEKKLLFGRHEVVPGEIFKVGDDICNSFETMRALIDLIERAGASVNGIVCFLNRSPTFESEFKVREGLVLPVISLVRRRIEEYRQDDYRVAEDIRRGNVILDPKKHWPELLEHMKRAA